MILIIFLLVMENIIGFEFFYLFISSVILELINKQKLIVKATT